MSEQDDKHLDRIYDAYFESSKQFDKQILFIASGSLAVSFSFIKDIVNLNHSICNCVLITSWVILAIVILLSLISHYLSLQALNNKLKYYYNEDEDKSDDQNKTVRMINKSMIILLVLGIVLLVTFVGINI